MSRPLRNTPEEEKLRQDIGRCLRAARAEIGLTQEEVAEKIDMKPEVYGRLERGHMAPSIYTFAAACRVLKVNPRFALGLVEHPAPPPPPAMTPHVERLFRAVNQLPRGALIPITKLAEQLAGIKPEPELVLAGPEIKVQS